MAFVTLVANDFYLYGCVALINSLKNVQTTATLYVIVTPNVTTTSDDYTYIARNAEIITVDNWPDDLHSLDKMSKYTLGSATSFPISKPTEFNANNNFLKLRIWEIFDKKYDKMMYLDADVVVLQNIDHLLAYFRDIPFAAACDINKNDFRKLEKLNSGVFLFTPCKKTYDDMIFYYKKKIAEGKIFDRTDQSLFEEFFNDWNHLSINYNTVWWRHLISPINLNSIKILHYTMQKPWDKQASFPQEMIHLVDLWKKYYDMKSDYKVDPSWFFFDYDGTLTDNHSAEIQPRIISCLKNLIDQQKKKVCIVTGRGFAYARTFMDILPVHAVICENGALIYEKTNNDIHMSILHEAIPNHDVLNLYSTSTFKHMISSEQNCRMYDVAIDIQHVDEDLITRIEDMARKNGFYYSRSNIHINIWKGKYNKQVALDFFLKKQNLFHSRNFIYFGDSPNDSCVFKFYPEQCVAMQNFMTYTPSNTTPDHVTRFHNYRGVIETIGRRLLIDMDNTIADWDKELFRQLPFLDRSKRIHWCIYQCFPENTEDIKQVIQKPGFYEQLQPISNAIECIQKLANTYDIYFVTAPPLDNCSAISEKMKWIERYLGKEYIEKLIFTSHKDLIDGDILIDDKVYPLSSWNHILYAQPYNNGTFQWDTMEKNNWFTFLK